MTALISKLKVMKLQNFLIKVELSRVIVQLAIKYLCDRNMSQLIWHQKTFWQSQSQILHQSPPQCCTHTCPNDPKKYNFTPYSFQDVDWTSFEGQGHYSNKKVKLRLQDDNAHLHPPSQCAYHVSTSYTFQFSR